VLSISAFDTVLISHGKLEALVLMPMHVTSLNWQTALTITP